MNDLQIPVAGPARSRFVVPFPYWLTPTTTTTTTTTSTTSTLRRGEGEGEVEEPPAAAAAGGGQDQEWTWTEATPEDPIWRPFVDAGGGDDDDDDDDVDAGDDFGNPRFDADDAAFQRRNYFVPEAIFAAHARSRTFVLRAPSPAASAAATTDLSWEPQGTRWARALQMRMLGAYMVLFEFPSYLVRGGGGGDNTNNIGVAASPSALHHGFLVVDLEFPRRVQMINPNGKADPRTDMLRLADVLQVNELFKYYRLPFQGHQTLGYADLLKNTRFDWRKQGTIAEVVAAANGAPMPRRALRNAYLGRWDWMLECPIILDNDGGGRSHWLPMPAAWIARARGFEQTLAVPRRSDGHDAPPAEATFGWLTYPDNRAFVWTAVAADLAYIHNPAAAASSSSSSSSSSDSSHWVRFVNVDLPSTNPTPVPTPFEQDWIRDRTYRRWAHFGSLYGFSYHSGAFWTAPAAADGDGDDGPAAAARNPFLDIFFGVYFDLALTLLYTRVVLLRIASNLALLPSPPPPPSLQWDVCDSRAAGEAASGLVKVKRELRELTRRYLPAVYSTQQQGHELAELFRKCMDVDALAERLARKVEVVGAMDG
ncbi:hypothetical protein DFJ73DRAFT_799396 [Zopfochytrium polystomum]|nr:hypothetical protein DFJ73DRAFT_799396 [Zopfochytrium polystomum]